MNGRQKLAAAFGDWMDRHGYTQQQVAAMGGPSTTTQSKVRLTDDPISRQTMKQLDTVMGWPAGTSAGILRGGDGPETVSGPAHDDESTLMYERPKGLSDAEWAKLKASVGEYVEWQLDRFSRER